MGSLRSNEGYLLIDHRFSPGVPDEVMVKSGLPIGSGRKDKVFEAATYTCADCQAIVVIEPKRTRARGYCPKCNHQLCDRCENVRVLSGGECKNFQNMVDRYLNALAAGAQAFGDATAVFERPSQPSQGNVFQSPLCK